MADELTRALMTIGCRDCDVLPKVANAGRIVDGPDGPVQIMHNGLKVVAGGYHGNWMAHVIRSTRGHHEPQEELLFAELLRFARHNSTMIELGAFWSYYSLWFVREVPGSRAICVEPDPANMSIGRRNAALNNLEDRISFVEAWAGHSATGRATMNCESIAEPRDLPVVDMREASLLAEGPIEILHIDAQGAELDFTHSIARAESRPRFLVLSTHHRSISGSATTHADCLAAIATAGGHILAQHDVQESFSGDGLIVASFAPQDRLISLPIISRNIAALSLFPDP